MTSNPSGLVPLEFNCIVELDLTETKTAGGIILPASKTERDELANEEGMLVAVSPHAFSYAEGWPAEYLPQPGDRILFARYAGAIHERGGRKFRVVKDRDIVAKVAPPALQAVA